MSLIKKIADGRPLVALITNHGYAGPKPPIANAPDTGGQNVYVNDLARALESAGKSVVIFTRGGFNEYGQHMERKGEVLMSDHIMYVYLQGGGSHFIPKENIAIALDEELDHLYRYTRFYADSLDRHPWEVFEYINSHYWDAGVLGYKLVERWQTDYLFDCIHRFFKGKIDPSVFNKHYDERHICATRRNWKYALGCLVLDSAGLHVPLNASIKDINEICMQALLGLCVDCEDEWLIIMIHDKLSNINCSRFNINHNIAAALVIGQILSITLEIDCDEFGVDKLHNINRHFWTPHSLGSIKEINYQKRSCECKRSLKFAERRHHEQIICERTPVIISTSQEVSSALIESYNVNINRITYLPPCVSNNYRMRTIEECYKGYKYLSEKSGISIEKLKSKKIILEASRADPTKRKDLVLESFIEVAKSNQDILLFVLGGPHNEVIHNFISIVNAECLSQKAFAIPDNIEQGILNEIFSLSHIYVSASQMEGFGMSVLQAAASGVPTICSEYIPFAQNYLPGFLSVSNSENANDYADIIKLLLNDSNKYDEAVKLVLEATKNFLWSERIKNLNYDNYKKVIFTIEKRLDL